MSKQTEREGGGIRVDEEISKAANIVEEIDGKLAMAPEFSNGISLAIHFQFICCVQLYTL